MTRAEFPLVRQSYSKLNWIFVIVRSIESIGR